MKANAVAPTLSIGSGHEPHLERLSANSDIAPRSGSVTEARLGSGRPANNKLCPRDALVVFAPMMSPRNLTGLSLDDRPSRGKRVGNCLLWRYCLRMG